MKPTKATVQQRVEEIYLIRLQGAGGVDIRQHVAQKEAAGEPPWTISEGGRPLSERSLWRYIGRADQLIAESCREGRKRRLQRHLSQRRFLYGLAVSQADTRAALSVLDSEAKLLGLFAPTKTQVTGKDGEALLSLESIVAAVARAEEVSHKNSEFDTGAGAGAAPPDGGSEALPG
jgi:hypothetical protein